MREYLCGGQENEMNTHSSLRANVAHGAIGGKYLEVCRNIFQVPFNSF